MGILNERAIQREKQMAYDLALRKWEAQQGIATQAPTPTGMQGYTQGAGMMPVSPHFTGAELQKRAVTPAAKVPTWQQAQKKAAIKSGIARGHVVIGKEWGEPEEFDIKSRADIYRAIELGGYNPNDPYWKDSLAKYPAPKMGSIVKRGGKSYEVTGFDKDGEPLVELKKK